VIVLAWRPYFTLDLLETGVLPDGWQSHVSAVANRFAARTELTGDGSTSREARLGQDIVVYVADGSVVKREIPWAWDLYNGLLRDFSGRCFGQSLYPARLERTAININVLRGRGARYEWHVDSNPVTGLLFCSTADAGAGGSLVFRARDSQRALVRPKAGTFICFDAREVDHRVAPLRRSADRISMPMNYYLSAVEQPRPDDLDAQIYTARV
jgi:hypothetical protein